MKEHSYTSLDKRLYTYSSPQQLTNPEMVIYNEKLGTSLGLDHLKDKPVALAAIFSGQQSFEEMRPIAQAYCSQSLSLGLNKSPYMGLVGHRLSSAEHKEVPPHRMQRDSPGTWLCFLRRRYRLFQPVPIGNGNGP